MRRSALPFVVAAILAGVPLAAASAGDGCCRHARHEYVYYGAPVTPYAAWRAYYEAQAQLSSARRQARANAMVATGRTIPSRYFGPPTNTYAESYALEPYSYFTCPEARRGDGICANLPPLSSVAPP